MKVEIDYQGTHQLLTRPPGGSQQAAPHLTTPTAYPVTPLPSQAALHLGLLPSNWGMKKVHQEEIISLPSQRQEGGEGISMN